MRLNSSEPSHVEVPDDRLVDAAAAGDRTARHALFERFRDAVYQTAFRVTGRHEDALDVVQDAFIKAFDRLTEFQRESGFKTWLLRIATNRSLDLLRARKVRLAAPLEPDGDEGRIEPAAPAENSHPGRGLEQREISQRLQVAVESLPADQRAVFALYATGGLTYGEIAEAVGIPIGTVMSRLFHARKKLHEILADLAPPDLKKARP
jgi:RNA polymerase sigma-70 factor (ECF subfamily)